MRKSVRRVAAGTVAVAASLATVVVTAPPAAADVETFTDRGGHLTTVRVRHGAENIRVTAHVGDYNFGSHFSFWLETETDDPGPEYKIKVYPNSDVVPIHRVESFAGKGSAIDCGYRASADAGGSEYVTIVVPRSCVGTPDRVRVSVRANYSIPGPNLVDWGPGRKRFFGWVAS